MKKYPLYWYTDEFLLEKWNFTDTVKHRPTEPGKREACGVILVIVSSKTWETRGLPRKRIDLTFSKYNLVASFTWSVLHYSQTVLPNWCPYGENWLISDFCYQKRALSNRTVHFFTNLNTFNVIQSLPSYIFIEDYLHLFTYKTIYLKLIMEKPYYLIPYCYLM